MKGFFSLFIAASLLWACGEAETSMAEEPVAVEEVMMDADTTMAPIDTTNATIDTTIENRPGSNPGTWSP